MKNISLSVGNTHCIAHGKVMGIFAIYLHSMFFHWKLVSFPHLFALKNVNPSSPPHPEYLLCRQGDSDQATLQNSLQEWDTEHSGAFL